MRINGDFDGFEVWIYAPPREHHRRAHVHLIRAGHQASIALPAGARGVELLEFTAGMPRKSLRQAIRIVEAHAGEFRKEWEKLHGRRQKDD